MSEHIDHGTILVLTVFIYNVKIDSRCVLDGCRKRALVQQPVLNGCGAVSQFE